MLCKTAPVSVCLSTPSYVGVPLMPGVEQFCNKIFLHFLHFVLARWRLFSILRCTCTCAAAWRMWSKHLSWGSPTRLFSEREQCKLTFTFAICCRSSVCRLSVCHLSSVTFVHPTQAIEIFGNVSTPFNTLAICWHAGKILRRSSQGSPSVEGVKHKTGRRI